MDRVVLTIPREREFSAVADLVLAGLGSRHDLTIDVIDDLQLALETLLEHEELDDELTLQLEIVGECVVASLGPFTRDALEAELDGESGPRIGLRRVLDATVDGVAVVRRENQICWVELRKEVSPTAGHAS